MHFVSSIQEVSSHLRSANPLNQRNRRNCYQQGFTLVETLIAGLLMILIMAAIGRMGVASLASSGTLAERRRIEEAIENHIQLIQQADSLLTYDAPYPTPIGMVAPAS